MLADKIYTIIHPETKKEVEAVLISDVINLIQSMIVVRLTLEDEQFIRMVFTNETLNNLIIFEEINRVMTCLGSREDHPISKKHLNYELLDLKSKRIMNRLCNHLQT